MPNPPIKDTFVYDDLGQLIRENNGRLNRTYVYTYDNAGNLTKKEEYVYTEGATSAATLLDTVTYTYGNSTWRDLLTAFDEQEITYDAIGNPLKRNTGDWEHRGRFSVLAKLFLYILPEHIEPSPVFYYARISPPSR